MDEPGLAYHILGGTWAELIGLTVILFGGAAFMMGQALAQTWRPAWQILPYGLLLAAGDRFLSYALFEGVLLSPSGLIIDAAILTAIAWTAYGATRAQKMVCQYPWLYERDGLFGWRERGPDAGENLAVDGRRGGS